MRGPGKWSHHTLETDCITLLLELKGFIQIQRIREDNALLMRSDPYAFIHYFRFGRKLEWVPRVLA